MYEYVFLVLTASVFLTAISSEPSECNTTKICVPKCCGEGRGYHGSLCQNDSSIFSVEIGNITDPDAYDIFSPPECESRMQQFPAGKKYNLIWTKSKLYLDSDLFLEPSEYCLESVWTKDNFTYSTAPFFCDRRVNDADDDLPKGVYRVGAGISVFVFILTILVYVVIPHLRDLNGMALCCYCMSCVVFYFRAAFPQAVWISFQNWMVLYVTDFIVSFFFTASFFWLNIMTIDMFWLIIAVTGDITRYRGVKQWKWNDDKGVYICEEGSDPSFIRRVFVWYSLYAWGVPLLMNAGLFFFVLKTVPSYEDLICFKCKVRTMSDYVIGIPIYITLVMNLLLMIIMLLRVWRFKWNVTGDHGTSKEKSFMYLRLYIVYIVATVLSLDKREHTPGVLTASKLNICFNLHGLAIFAIFVLEPRVLHFVSRDLRIRLSDHVKRRRQRDCIWLGDSDSTGGFRVYKRYGGIK